MKPPSNKRWPWINARRKPGRNAAKLRALVTCRAPLQRRAVPFDHPAYMYHVLFYLSAAVKCKLWTMWPSFMTATVWQSCLLPSSAATASFSPMKGAYMDLYMWWPLIALDFSCVLALLLLLLDAMCSLLLINLRIMSSRVVLNVWLVINAGLK